MKGNFAVSVNLMKLEEQLTEHKPYATLAVSTTGIDNSNFDGHYPTRVSLRVLEYDNQTGVYADKFHFDKMVMATPEAIAEAKKNKDNYDVFAHAGISEEDYLEGNLALSPAEFKKEFEPYILTLQEDQTLLIANGGLSFVDKYLGKIDCSNDIDNLAKNNLVLDQTAVTREYFAQKNISDEYFLSRGLKKGCNLENLNAVIRNVPYASFYNDTNLMLDFTTRSKEEFLSMHPDIHAEAYEITAKFSEKISEDILGTGKRTNIMNKFVQKFGRENGLIASEIEVGLNKNSLDYIASLSEQGKKNYKDGNLQSKLEILTRQKVLDIDRIEGGNSTYHKLISAVENTDNKGIVIFHTATTGFEYNKNANGKTVKDTGFPIQFSALAYIRDESGKINFENPRGMQIDIQAPRKQLLSAKENRDKFDTFADTGIDLSQYEQGIASDGSKVRSMDEAIQEIYAFTKKFTAEDYQMVTIGGDFSQKALAHLSENLTLCSTDCLDFTQAIKEYSYIVNSDKAYSSNVIFNGTENTLDKFDIRTYAQAQNASIKSTSDKCDITAQGIKKMYDQYIEIYKPEEQVISQDKTMPAPVKNEPVSKPVVKEEYIDEDGMFIEGSEYPTEKFTDSSAEREAQQDFEAHIEEVISSAPQKTEQKTSPIIDKSNEEKSQPKSASLPQRPAPERPQPLHNTEPTIRQPNTSHRNSSPIYNTGARANGRPPIPPAQSHSNNDEISSIQSDSRQNMAGNTRTFNRAGDTPANRPINPRNAVPNNARQQYGDNPRNSRPINQAAPPAAIGIDINRLIDTINKQNETINQLNSTLMALNATNAEQAKIIAEQNRQLMQAMQMQNALMQEMLASKASIRSYTPPMQYGKISEQSDINNVVVNLEEIKEQISSINAQIEGKASMSLSEANVYLSKGQKELLEENEKNQKPLNRG